MFDSQSSLNLDSTSTGNVATVTNLTTQLSLSSDQTTALAVDLSGLPASNVMPTTTSLTEPLETLTSSFCSLGGAMSISPRTFEKSGSFQEKS